MDEDVHSGGRMVTSVSRSKVPWTCALLLPLLLFFLAISTAAAAGGRRPTTSTASSASDYATVDDIEDLKELIAGLELQIRKLGRDLNEKLTEVTRRTAQVQQAIRRAEIAPPRGYDRDDEIESARPRRPGSASGGSVSGGGGGNKRQRPKGNARFPGSCADLQETVDRRTLSREGSAEGYPALIYPFGPEGKPVEVLCDFENQGGGWTVIQFRIQGAPHEFDNNWAEYEEGFGSDNGSYWLGLKAIHAMTHAEPQELRVELYDWFRDKRFAQYNQFAISDAADGYRLAVSGYTGNAGDALTVSHNGQQFSTKDKDQDKNPQGNCAEIYHGGWWYTSCTFANLNGIWRDREDKFAPFDGIVWYQWRGDSYSYPEVSMKIRPQGS